MSVYAGPRAVDDALALLIDIANEKSFTSGVSFRNLFGTQTFATNAVNQTGYINANTGNIEPAPISVSSEKATITLNIAVPEASAGDGTLVAINSGVSRVFNTSGLTIQPTTATQTLATTSATLPTYGTGSAATTLPTPTATQTLATTTATLSTYGTGSAVITFPTPTAIQTLATTTANEPVTIAGSNTTTVPTLVNQTFAISCHPTLIDYTYSVDVKQRNNSVDVYLDTGTKKYTASVPVLGDEWINIRLSGAVSTPAIAIETSTQSANSASVSTSFQIANDGKIGILRSNYSSFPNVQFKSVRYYTKNLSAAEALINNSLKKY